MKIVIAGAGDMGYHLAELLYANNQDITLIDDNYDVLEAAAQHLDVLTIHGDAASPTTLEKAEVGRARLLLAVTANETTNIVAALLARQLGTKQTLARVANTDYVREDVKGLFKNLGIENIFSPNLLAAKEIHRLVRRCSFTDVFEFENGKLILAGITLSEESPLTKAELRNLAHSGKFDLRIIAVQRGAQTFIPHGNDRLRPNDHIYVIVPQGQVDTVEQITAAQKIQIKKIMILGGSTLALETARLLEKDYDLTVVEKDKERCKYLAAQLEHALVINGSTDNIELLLREGLEHMDAFIALTPNSETNIIASLTAKSYGVRKTIAQVENKEYIRISHDIGVDTLINKKIIAANNIFRFVRKGTVEAITGIHGVNAEVIEFVITRQNQLTRKPLKDLHFPQGAIVGGVIRGNDCLIPDGQFVFQVGDKVIVFALPEAISRVENLFR